MSTEQNKANYRRFIEEVWNKGSLDVFEEIASPDVVFHSPPGTPPGWEGMKQVIASFRAAFPDVCLTVEDQIAEKDRTVVRLTITGTHRGPFRSPLKTLLPTGKTIHIQVIDILRHDANGKLAECWSGFDVFGMLQQLGVIPAADPSDSEAITSTVNNEAFRSTVMERFEVDGIVIEYQVQGNGEPVLLIPPSVTIDGLGLPLLTQPQLASRFQLIHYHRRGYLGSTLGTDPLTIALEAGDAAMLLRHLGLKTAHIVGHSIGGLIALQLAVDEPDLVHSLALLEPPIYTPNGRAHMGGVFKPVMEAYRSGNKRAAIEIFSNAVFGPNWQPIVEQIIPGGVEQAVNSAELFLTLELPAIQSWQFGPQEAAVIREPILSVLGARSSQIEFVKEVRQLLHSWFPQTEDLDVPTTHLLQMQDPKGVAQGLAEFFSRHPIMQGHEDAV